MATLEIGVN